MLSDLVDRDAVRVDCRLSGPIRQRGSGYLHRAICEWPVVSPEPLTKDGWEIDGCPVNGPAISSNGNNVAVAWFTAADDDKPQVQVLMSSDAGKTFGKKVRIDGGNPVGHVDVASLATGAAVVSWIERTGQGSRVHLRQVGANGVAGSPVNVSGTAGARSGGFPRMKRSGNEVVIAWTDAGETSRVLTAVVSVPGQ